MIKFRASRITSIAVTNVTILALVMVTVFGSSLAFAQLASDPSMEVFRIRCQIDSDIDPVTGLTVPKVQIQAKVRADLLDGLAVGIMVENISAVVPPLPAVINSTFIAGTATADWDTFPDPASLNPVSVISGDFVVGDEFIKITAQVTSTGQIVSDIGQCADKTAAQFQQQTKGVCTLSKFNRDKCKSGDTFTTADGVEHTLLDDEVTWSPPIL